MKRLLAVSIFTALASANQLPAFTRGAYLTLADNTVQVKNDQGKYVLSTGDWSPKLGPWVNNFNVFFFAFIDSDMLVPPAYENARTSGQFAPGTKIIYSVCGGAYSRNVQAWKVPFGSVEAGRATAAKVAQWKSDGVDLDFEVSAGNDPAISAGVIAFVQELRRLRPDMIITQAVFGYPQMLQESVLTVMNWDVAGKSSNLLQSIGIMVYEGTDSLKFVGQYTGSVCSKTWCALCGSAGVSSPCSSVPTGAILAGLDGGASQADLDAVCGFNDNQQRIGGYMMWYASADNGFSYGGNGDARLNPNNLICKQDREHKHHLHHHHHKSE